jgi:hypothetical protein
MRNKTAVVAGSNPAPATNLILLNRNGWRVWRWPFFLFIAFSNVQNLATCHAAARLQFASSTVSFQLFSFSTRTNDRKTFHATVSPE